MFLCVLGLKLVWGSLGTLLFPCRGLTGPVCCVWIGVGSFDVFGVFWLCCLLLRIEGDAFRLVLVTFPLPFCVGWLRPPLKLACQLG